MMAPPLGALPASEDRLGGCLLQDMTSETSALHCKCPIAVWLQHKRRALMHVPAGSCLNLHRVLPNIPAASA